MKIRTLCAALALVALLPGLAFAQVETDPTTNVRQITSTSATQDVILGPLTSRGTATIQLYGTWVGTYPIQGSLSRDCTTGGTYFTIPGTSSLTSNGGTQVTVAGIRCIKIPASGWVSGTTNVIIQASGTGGGGPASLDSSGLATELTLTSVRDSLNTLLTQLGTDVTEDQPETVGGTGPMVMNVRRDAAAASCGTSGDNCTFNTDALGLLWTRFLDPCSAVAKTPYVINISTATTTELTPSLAGSGNYYYICSIDIGPVAGAQTFALVDDDSDGCGSVTSGMAGGTTAATGWSINSGGGLTIGSGLGTIAKTNGTNRVVCAVTGQAVQTSGVMMAVAAP